MSAIGYGNSLPGITDRRNSVETDIGFQSRFGMFATYDALGIIASTARDPLHVGYEMQLRAGLLMANIAGSWTQYDADANDGSQFCSGVLAREVFVLDPSTGNAISKPGLIATSGNLKVSESQAYGLDARARAQLKAQGFTFDDMATSPAVLGHTYAGAKSVTAATTLTSADYGRLIVSVGAGALTHTLPALVNGAVIEILNAADQNMTVSSAATNDIVAVNDLSASTVAASTTAMKIGARFQFVGTYIGGTLKWVFSDRSAGAVTITVT